jgi:hypothetical protein
MANDFGSSSVYNKIDFLSAKKDEKLNRLTEATKVRSYSDSLNRDTESVMPDGYVENNGNKIWTQETLNPAEWNYAVGQEAATSQLPAGDRNSRRLYMYGTKDQEGGTSNDQLFDAQDYEGPSKVGLSTGRNETSNPRYDGSKYDLPGEVGVDVNKRMMDLNLDWDSATALEGLRHSMKSQFGNRLIREREDGLYDYNSPDGLVVIDEAEKDRLFGSGSSEYYSEVMDDQGYAVDKEKVARVMAEAKRKAAEDRVKDSKEWYESRGLTYKGETLEDVANRYNENATAQYDDDILAKLNAARKENLGIAGTVSSEVGNWVDALQYGVGRKAAGVGDALADAGLRVAKGSIEYLTDGEVTEEQMNRNLQQNIRGTALEGLFAENGDFIGFDSYKEAATYGYDNSDTKEVLDNVAQAYRKGDWLGVGSEILKGVITAGPEFLLESSGEFAMAFMGPLGLAFNTADYSNQIMEDRLEAKGEDLNAGDRAVAIAGGLAMGLLNKLGADEMVGNTKVVKTALDTVKKYGTDEQAKSVAKRLVGMTATVAATAGGKGAYEGLEEIAQEAVSIVAEKVGTKEAENILSEDSGERLVQAFAGGFSAGATMGGLSGTPSMEGLNKILPNINKNIAKSNPEVTTEEEALSNRNSYKDSLKRVTGFQDVEITEKEISSLLDDLENMERNRSYIEDADPETLKRADESTNKVIDKVADFVNKNPNLKLTKRNIRKFGSAAENDTSVTTSDEAVDESSDKAAGTLTSFDIEYNKTVNKETQRVPGTVSENADGSYTLVTDGKTSKFLTREKLDSFINNKSRDVKVVTKEDSTEEDSLILGSAPRNDNTGNKPTSETIDEILEEDYTDEARSADAERIMHITLRSSFKDDAEFQNNLSLFAKNNGVKESRINKIIKSYQSVEEESTIGDRGRLARESRLNAMLSSGSVDKNLVRKEFKELQNFYTSTSKSIRNLEEGIMAAQFEADKLNKIDEKVFSKKEKHPGKDPKAVPVKTNYLKYDKSNFLVYVRFNRGQNKWVVDDTTARKNLASKKETAGGIQRALKRVSSKAYPIMGQELSSGSFIIPKAALGTKKSVANLRTRDENHLEKQRVALEKEGLFGNITKVIVDDSVKKSKDKSIVGRSSKWKEGSDYRNANLGLINTKESQLEEYSSDDVVLLHALGVRKTSDGKMQLSTIRDKKNISTAQTELFAAMEAGATIVLDSDYLPYKGKSSNSVAKQDIIKYMESNNYLRVPGTLSFVPYTEEKAARFETIQKEVTAKSAATKTRKADDRKSKTELQNLFAQSIIDGTLSKEYEAKFKEVEDKYFNKEQKETEDTVIDDADDDIDITSTSKSSEEKLQDYLQRTVNKRVDNYYKNNKAIEQGVLTESDRIPESAEIIKLAKAKAKNLEVTDAKINTFIEYWNKLNDEGVVGKELDKKLGQYIDDNNIPAETKSLASSLLSGSSVGASKPDSWEVVFKNVKNDGTFTTKSVVFSSEEAAKNVPEVSKKPWGQEVKLSVRKVTVDPNKFLQVNKSTILNTIPLSILPEYISSLGNRFKKSAEKLLASVTPAEKATAEEYEVMQKGGKAGDRQVTGVYTLHDSPARALFMGRSGVSPEVAAAMSIAVMDTLLTDKKSLTKGYKNQEEVARLFNVQPHEVTREMSDFAKDIGNFNKTVATNIGKKVAKLLGYTAKDSEELGYGTFARFIADLGNNALTFAYDQGLVEFEQKDSKELEKLLNDTSTDIKTENFEGAKVYFVNIKSKKDGKRYIVDPKIDSEITMFKSVAEKFPGFISTAHGPLLNKLSEEEIAERTSEVRNDALGLEVPEQSAETLRTMMDTAYVINVDQAKEFVSLFDDNSEYQEDVLKQLGFIEVDETNYEYQKLSYRQKEIQPAINDSVLTSVQYVKEFLEANQDKANKNGEIETYFPFSFINNGRFHLDSNTINPQTDKLHRFLVNPKDNFRVYNYNRNNGTFTYTYKDSSGKEKTKKVSLLVRVALGQAFGYGVDKKTTEDIIKNGNLLLALNKDDLVNVRNSLLKKGEAVVKVNGEELELEAGHLTHSLQALDFLMQLQEGNVVESYLSAEFDSLTSGFANKLQQLPILGEGVDDITMHEHLARTGVITNKYLDLLKQTFEGFDPEIHSVNDILGGAEGFLDSYKNLAAKSLEALPKKLASLKFSGDAKDMRTYTTVSTLISTGILAGSDQIVDGASSADMIIDSVMRNLFKYPFMIFNYSASISRIKKTLTNDMTNDMIDMMSKANLKDKSDKGTKALQALSEKWKFSFDDKPASKVTPSALQKAFRETPIYSIKIGLTGKKGRYNTKFYEYIDKNLSDVYGSTIEEVFQKEFKEYVEIQDATNNAFKVMFRVFDAKRMELLKEKSERGWYSKKDVKDIVDELWNDFPYIMGPLSNRKEGLKDVIPIYKTVVGSPTSIEEAGAPGQLKLKDLYKNKNDRPIKVRPLQKSIDEATSSGSVLPFHFIDGAEMSEMFKQFVKYLRENNVKAGTLGIHDAKITALTESDESGFFYHKGMFKINSEYSILESLRDKINSIDLKGIKLDKLSAKGLKNVFSPEELEMYFKEKKSLPFGEALKRVAKDVNDKADAVKATKEAWKATLDSAWYGNLVGTPGGMFNPSIHKDSLNLRNYEERFELAGVYTVGPNKTAKPSGKTKQKATSSGVKEDNISADLKVVYDSMKDSEKANLRKILKEAVDTSEDKFSGNVVVKTWIDKILEDC